MSDSIFTQYHDKREKDIIYKPRSGDEMMEATLHKVPLHTYSDLCKQAENIGASRLLSALFRSAEQHIVLLQDPSNMQSGHWFSISRDLPRKSMYFFSTYGGRPDREKIAWISKKDLDKSGQLLNIFNDSLKELQKHGWEIHYNDYPYQKPKDDTAVCGIYTVAFLRSGKNPDEFEKDTLSLVNRGINPAIFYFDKYFN